LVRVLTMLPPTFAVTRVAMHAVAEQVVAPARFHVDGHIGLRPTAGGFGTPVFGAGEVVRVEGVDIVHEQQAVVRRAALTTLRAAAAFADVPLGAPDVYPPATDRDPDAKLDLDLASAEALAGWYDYAQRLLAALTAIHPGVPATAAQLWPEHFDLAIDLGDEAAGTRGTYGASPGDETIGEPYLYATAWDPARRTGPLTAYPFGAAVRHRDLLDAGDPERAGSDFLASCARLVLEGAG
jgi:hypothetical protein